MFNNPTCVYYMASSHKLGKLRLTPFVLLQPFLSVNFPIRPFPKHLHKRTPFSHSFSSPYPRPKSHTTPSTRLMAFPTPIGIGHGTIAHLFQKPQVFAKGSSCPSLLHLLVQCPLRFVWQYYNFFHVSAIPRLLRLVFYFKPATVHPSKPQRTIQLCPLYDFEPPLQTQSPLLSDSSGPSCTVI